MANNTQVTAGAGDFIRDIDKAGAKTQVTILDMGGTGAESLLTVGQQAMAGSVPVAIASDQGTLAVSGPLTNTQLRATEVPVSLTTASSVSVANFPTFYPVTDNSGSLTVDAPFDTPVAVRLSDGTTWLSTLGVSVVQLPTALVSGRLDVNVGAVTTSSTLPVSVGQLPAALAANGGLKVEGVAGGVAVPVSGTFFQTTQPVSGTFWQTTQPVSIATAVAVTDNSGSLTVDSTQLPVALAANGGLKIEGVSGGVAVPVSGTFFQTTQPVSIGTTVAVSAPVAAPVFVRLSDGSAAITTLPVSITTASSMSVICSTANTLSVAVSTAGVVAVGGDIASAAADSGNPVKIGGKAIVGAAVGGLPTAVAANQRTNALMDVYGRMAVRATDAWAKNSNPGGGAQATCNSTAQASGVRNVCTSLALSLSSTAAATATNPVTFSLYDGTTAGTVLWVIKATMPLTAGAAWTYSQSGLWIEGTAATAMTLATAAATTTVVAATVSMTGTITQ